MSKLTSDSFLPSGALDSPRKYLERINSASRMMSPPIHSPHSAGSPSRSPNNHSMSQSQSHPISPPKTRSGSAEEHSAALVEDWRTYTQNLRSQFEGERAHMYADRARMEEVMAEERALWDTERDILKTRILLLEAQLGQKVASPPTHIPRSIGSRQRITSPGSNGVSGSGSIDSAHIRAVPQESGRNADGSPFYAPAPRNPSRTFDPSENTDLRVDDVHAPRGTAICVTSKELTSSDFIQSPPNTHDLEAIHETHAESIDISLIQPELEGVSLKASAVDPVFAAKILSPRRSPQKLSPDTKPPARPSMSRGNSRDGQKMTLLEVVTQPENRRLTMHAGHTPNHSLSQFAFLGPDGESGNATPTQERQNGDEHAHVVVVAPPAEVAEVSKETFEEYDQDDRELSGPLGLTNDPAQNDFFLEKLVEKLEEARRSADVSPSNETESSIGLTPSVTTNDDEDEDDDKDEGPRLKLKPSINFGRPLGSI